MWAKDMQPSLTPPSLGTVIIDNYPERETVIKIIERSYSSHCCSPEQLSALLGSTAPYTSSSKTSEVMLF